MEWRVTYQDSHPVFQARIRSLPFFLSKGGDLQTFFTFRKYIMQIETNILKVLFLEELRFSSEQRPLCYGKLETNITM